ncbi:hypothetical protein AGABI2DRAFT_209713, partial [Agaricus bisporus var. bisporus H97]|uniref:hypothetical protein n=1 Tax=Agaricus bisporus var. bisporus (strain H97 / ATCC MYA-4626 / FGSC 10389) TaxID=936046 RepID=UPI00029F7E70
MSSSSKSRVLGYSEAARILTNTDVQRDSEDACRAFTKLLPDIMEKFESIAKLIHSIDMLSLTIPLRPRWDSLQRDFSELLWQLRMTAGNISGRLKVFCSTILPMVTTSPGGGAMQALQNFMRISSDHANAIRALAEHAMRLNSVLASFHTEFSKFTVVQTRLAQTELMKLSSRIHELDLIMRELSTSNGRLSNPDPTHLVYTVLRVGASTGTRHTRSSFSHQKLALTGPVAHLRTLYDSFDKKRDEVAYTLYATQMCFGKGDKFSTTQICLSKLVFDVVTHLESDLSLLLAIWARLLAD